MVTYQAIKTVLTTKYILRNETILRIITGFYIPY